MKITTLVDDLDQTTPASQTLTFGIVSEETGRLIEIEIDLNDENYDKYNDMLLLLASKGREVLRQLPKPGKRVAVPARKTSGDTADERAFLRALGHQVSDRGRIAGNLHELWLNRGGGQAVKAPEKDAEAPVTAVKGQDTDQDEKAEQKVVQRVKATPAPKAARTRRPNTRGTRTDSGKIVEIPSLREALSLGDGE